MHGSIRLMGALLLAALVLGAVLPAQQGGGSTPEAAQELDELVTLRTAAARAACADRLAPERPIGEWLAAVRSHKPWLRLGDPEQRGRQRDGMPLPEGTGGGGGSVALEWFVPDGAPPAGGWPVILALHGAGGAAAAELERWLPIAAQVRWVVLAPGDAGPNLGFRPGDPGERAVPLAALRWLACRCPLDLRRVVVTGTSRGAHLAWDLALRHPDRFCGLAPFIGGPRLAPAGGQNNLRFLEHLVGLPIVDLQGEGDDPLLLRNLRLAFRELEELGAADARLLVQPDMGHSYRWEAVDWAEWLAGLGPAPVAPDTRIRLAAEPDPEPVWGVQVTALDTEEVAVEPRIQIRQRKWDRLDADGRAEYLHRALVGATGRIALEREAPGRLRVRSSGVEEIRLLLRPAELVADASAGGAAGDPAGEPPDAGQLAAGHLVVRARRRQRLAWRGDPAVLLRHYAERLDPRDLPIAEVTLPLR